MKNFILILIFFINTINFNASVFAKCCGDKKQIPDNSKKINEIKELDNFKAESSFITKDTYSVSGLNCFNKLNSYDYQSSFKLEVKSPSQLEMSIKGKIKNGTEYITKVTLNGSFNSNYEFVGNFSQSILKEQINSTDWIPVETYELNNILEWSKIPSSGLIRIRKVSIDKTNWIEFYIKDVEACSGKFTSMN